VIEDELYPAWIAYQELDTCRPYIGFGTPGPIPWDKIDLYAQRHCSSEEEYDYLLTVIRAMDETYLAHARKKIEDG